MSAHAKSAKEDPEKVEETGAAFAAVMHNGVERLANLQKATLDLLSHQTTDINNTWRDTLKVTAETPANVFLELTEEAVKGWIGAQKDVLDLMVEQSHQALQFAKERPVGSNSAAVLNELVQRSAERTVAAQKIVLDFAGRQNKGLAEAVKRQVGVAGTPVASVTESLQRGVETLLETQKEFLEAAARFPKAAGAKK